MSKPIEIALDNYNTDPELFKNLNKAHPNSYVRIREGSVWQNLKVIARFSNTEDAVNTLFEAGYVLAGNDTMSVIQMVPQNHTETVK